MAHERLQGLAQFLGDPYLAEFNEMHQLAQDGLAVRVALNGQRAAPAPAPVGAGASGTRGSHASAKTTVAVQIDLLRAAAQGPAALAKAKERAYGVLGIHDAANRRRVVGALYARTQKKFVPDFVRRVVAECGPAMTSQLAEWYSTVTGAAVTEADLRRQAKIRSRAR